MKNLLVQLPLILSIIFFAVWLPAQQQGEVKISEDTLSLDQQRAAEQAIDQFIKFQKQTLELVKPIIDTSTKILANKKFVSAFKAIGSKWNTKKMILIQIGILLLLIALKFWWQSQTQFWLYKGLISLTMSGMILLTTCGIIPVIMFGQDYITLVKIIFFTANE